MKVYLQSIQILLIAMISRIFYILIAFLSSKLFIPYDKSTKLVNSDFFSFLLRWDAINFYQIANESYSSEHITAFFPLFPFLVQKLSKITGFSILNSGILVSNSLFCISCLILFHLSNLKYQKNVSYLSTILFAFNPASIVYSSMYSESTFAFLFILGLLLLELKLKKSIVCFALCGLARSNGILFLLFSFANFTNKLLWIIQIIPFALYQLYSLIMLKVLRIYIPYSYIQKIYWEQGFLRFYTYSKNIPNFLVAIPFLAFVIYLLLSYLKSYKSYSQNTKVLIILLLIQTLMTIFLIHAQMFFRFISYNPIIYWSIAFMILERGFEDMSYVLAFYFGFGVAYTILFGSYYPPA